MEDQSNLDPGNFEDSTDFELTHQMVAGEPGRDHLAEMAEAFVVEFMRMRWSNEAILSLFRNPYYVGPHCVYREKGEEYVVDLIKSFQRV